MVCPAHSSSSRSSSSSWHPHHHHRHLHHHHPPPAPPPPLLFSSFIFLRHPISALSFVAPTAMLLGPGSTNQYTVAQYSVISSSLFIFSSSTASSSSSSSSKVLHKHSLTASATQTISYTNLFLHTVTFYTNHTYTSFCADQFLPRHGFSRTTLAPTIFYTNQLLFFFELTRRSQKQPGGRQNAEELFFFPLYFHPFFSGTQDIQSACPLFATVSSL